MNTSGKINKAGQCAALLTLAASLTVAPATFSSASFSMFSAAYADEASQNLQTVTASDGATVTGVKVIENGKALEITGSGWKHPQGGGSLVSIKADKGTIRKNGNGVIARADADAEGNFKVTIDFPSAANGYNTDWAVGTSHTLHFLSGSGKEGDAVRSPVLKITVAQAGVDPTTVVDTSDWTELKAEEASLKIRPFTSGNGAKLRLIGQGWTKADGKSGSVVAIKLGSSSTTYFERSDNSLQNAYLKSLGKSQLGGDHTAWVLLTSDPKAVNEAAGIYLLKDDGSFDLEIDTPEALQKASAGQYLTVQALSGRFAEGDTKRSAVSATIPVDGKAFTKENTESSKKCVTTASTPSMKILNPTVEAGGQLHLVGSGWCNPAGKGAPRIAIKIDEAKISHTDTGVHSNKTIWALIDPNAETGEIDTYLQLPKADGSDSNTVLAEGAHSLRVLSGSLKTGDMTISYGGAGVLDFNIGQYRPNNLPNTVTDSELSDSQGQGVTLTKNGQQVTVKIPRAKVGQWVAVTPYDDGSVRSAWGSGWMQVSAEQTISYTLADGLPAGDYKFAVQSGESDSYGKLLGWASLTIAATTSGTDTAAGAQGSTSAETPNNQSNAGISNSSKAQNTVQDDTSAQGSSWSQKNLQQIQASEHNSVLPPTVNEADEVSDPYNGEFALSTFSAQNQTTQKITKVAVAQAPNTAQTAQPKNVQKTQQVQAASGASSSPTAAASPSATEKTPADALLATSEEKSFWNSTNINNALLVTAALIVIGVLLIPNRRQG